MTDPRLFAPAAARNRGPILDVLREALPPSGLVLEIASGTGEHVAHFAAALPDLTFQPSDPGAPERASILGWIAASGAKNILAPLALDAAALPWPVSTADAILCINMIHISPWAATEGLFDNAARLLPDGGPLVLYGAYKRGGAPAAPGNVAFDEMLRRQNPEWGVRDLETVAALAARSGFGAPRIVEMPANNLSVVFRRTRAD
jgi:SAM-dependent methyltransferase